MNVTKSTGKRGLLVFLAGFLIPSLLIPNSALAKDVTITIIHTNDVHGHLFPGRDDLSPGEPRPTFGGARAFARYVGQMRAKQPNQELLLLDCGDVFHGTPEGDFTRGQAIVDFFNVMKYDAAVVGNHEFAYGVNSFVKMAKRSHFAWLGANILAPKNKDFATSVVKGVKREIAGVKVAILGVTTQRCNHLNKPVNTTGLQFKNVFEIVPPLVKKLKKEGYLTIVITHMGSDADRQLSSLIPDCAALLGGHDHVVVSEASKPDSPLLAQSGEYLRRAGQVQLRVRPPENPELAPTLISAKNTVVNLIPITGPAQNQDEKNVIAFLKEQRFKSFDIPVARAKAAFQRNFNQRGPSRIGTFVAEALCRQTKSDAAFIGLGGLRGGLPAGIVSLRDLYLVYPFEDPIIVLELTGKDFIKAFRNHLRGGRLNLGSSGIQFKYDVTAKTSKRVTEVMAGTKKVTKDGVYRLAVTDYTFQKLLIERRIKPLKVIQTPETVFSILLKDVNAAPDHCAAGGSFLGVLAAERGERELVDIPEPTLKAVHVQSPAKLWRTHKINVNTADEELLASVPWISTELARAIIATRAETGEFATIDDLSKVPGINKDEIKKFDRFLKVR
jgi:competence ComEA-like helix-hairpin-helix protein